MPLLEPNIYALWAAKQAAKGSPVAAAGMTRRLQQVAGDFATARDDGAEAFGDLPQAGNAAASKYGGEVDWINSVLGNGEPGIHSTPTELAWLLWLFHGAETVTAVASVPGPPLVPASSQHRFTPQVGRGFYATFVARVGNAVVRRHKFNDSFIGRVQIEGGTGNKVVRITPRILSLDSGEVFTADPTTPATLPTDRPFLYTDGAGEYRVNNIVQRGQTQFTLVIDDAWDPVFGDDTVPYDFQQGNPSVTLSASMHFSEDALAEANRIFYGTPTPAAGTKPSKNVSALGSYSVDLKQRDATGALTGRRFVLTIPGVKWTPPAYPGPNPGGGGTELALAGSMRPVAGQQPYTIDVYTDPAVTAFTD